jgi:DNA-binding IclR family transcriptional regulator
MPAADRNGSLGVIGKATSLLDRLAADGEASAAQLSDALGEPRTTVYRLIRALERAGFVEPAGAAGRYRLGLKLFRLGGAVVARFDERQAALPHMEALHAATGETVFLCIRRDLEAVCIERLEGSRAVSLALTLGGVLPLHAGAAPRVLLAEEPRAAWQEYHQAARRLPALAPPLPARAGDLFAELEAVRRTGFAVSDEDVTVGIAAIGAPVRDHRGAVTAALSISGVRPAILGRQRARMIKLVVEAAAAVSTSLGYQPARAGGVHE